MFSYMKTIIKIFLKERYDWVLLKNVLNVHLYLCMENKNRKYANNFFFLTALVITNYSSLFIGGFYHKFRGPKM